MSRAYLAFTAKGEALARRLAEAMIPKIIHYCWFGRGEKPELAKRCIASWRKLCPAA